MELQINANQSLQEQWPQLRAQLLPQLDRLEPTHALLVLHHALAAEYDAAADLLCVGTIAAVDLTYRRRPLRLLRLLLDSLVLSGPGVWAAFTLEAGLPYGAQVGFWLLLVALNLCYLVQRRKW